MSSKVDLNLPLFNVDIIIIYTSSRYVTVCYLWSQIVTANLYFVYQISEGRNIKFTITYKFDTYTKQVNPKILLQNYTHCTHGRMRFKCIKIPNADFSQLYVRSLITYFYGLCRTYYCGLCTKKSTSCRGNNE